MPGGCAATTNCVAVTDVAWCSKEPMSTVLPVVRVKPVLRWSVVSGAFVVGSTARARLPAPMAGLPGQQAPRSRSYRRWRSAAVLQIGVDDAAALGGADLIAL